ncbi:type II secretion system F family protein [Patescibacteria group bacterium]|nr:type II secretion system F family protein [Patescibacteria group bacterium]MBU0880121.1 type II secretion system F family protein [Patescibacteria group bacterium]MBU0898102.1 type II secretion system F family protein [Patescibacteria group bacterium]MBU1991810.1 type II secretion system F family protein [Patescibacteria group bacterium]
MSTFKYKALDKNKKIVAGLLEVASKEFAEETLKEKDLLIIELKELSSRRLSGMTILERVSGKDLVIFSRQFAIMISANMVIVQSLKIIVDQTASLKLKNIILKVATEVDGGTKLSDALANWPDVFSNFYVSVVRSGETSGKLDEILNYLADEMEKDYDMMNKIKGAMIYPVFVLCGLIVVGMVMMIYVVPKLTNILSEGGAELPITTKILIGTSNFLASYWIIILLASVVIFFGLRFYTSKPTGKKQIDYLKLKLPIFGKLFQLIYLVRFTRSMNTLIVSGITISDSLKVVAGVVNNKIYQELIEQTILAVNEGNSISSVFSKSNEIPKMVSQMINIGERTGKLDVILDRITVFYGRAIANTIANLMTLMEPVIMVVMGIAVGIMVAAIILPMYNLAGQV